uniref:PH domain-containing protein n=1 Tax=Globisporangium ultimum (strain ATCC 200006 / CBS 805.95 / DAOM BR144) TaxID=431595 RepID=K3WMN9_GLOUD
MEDYIRGIVCGYLTVQHGIKGDAKRNRMFLVLSDSRIDYYVTDPRPEFEQKIATAYIFTPATRLHYYVELNARAPPHSFSLTTDKATDVYIADTDADAKTWYHRLHERLNVLATMVKGTLFLRKEISVHDQFKRMLLRTKYKWKQRYIELGRSSLRFCKESEKKTRMMKQFVLTAQSFVSEDEGVEFLKQYRILVSYATAIQPDAKMLAQFKRERQQNHGVENNYTPPASRHISTAYPFVIATGQAHLFLAAPSEHIRSDWVTAIRMRIISLKYRHNAENKKKEADGDNVYQLCGFMDVQIKPNEPWKKRFVELDQDSRVRVKASERKVGAKFETQLIPTCYVAPTLVKANAFALCNLGHEISLAPGSIKETERWVATLQRAAKSIRATKVQKLFEDDIRALLTHSIVYTVDVPARTYAGLVVERFRKRIVVLSHEPPSQDADTAGAKTKKKAKAGIPPIIIPQGSILVSISQFGMAHDSFETIWHHLRHKKGHQHPMTLTFRAPCTKHGVLGVKWCARDVWILQNCVLEHGRLRITSLDTSNANGEGCKSHDVAIVADLPLRHCQVELMSEENCKNGLKVTLTGGSGCTTSALATTLFLNVPLDTDAFLWFALLHLESAIAQDDIRYPLSVATFINSRDSSAQKKATKKNPQSCLREDQRRCFQKCSVVGVRVKEIEKMVKTVDPMLVLQLGSDDFGPPPTAITETKSNDDIQLTIMASAGAATGSNATERHPFTDADIVAFFHHLDPIGCGKISSVALTQLMAAITRHLVKDSNSNKQSQMESTTNENPQQQSVESRPGVLSAFYTAMKDLENLNGNGQKEDANMSLSLSEFRTVMQSITDADVLDLVQKLTRHDIQWM